MIAKGYDLCICSATPSRKEKGVGFCSTPAQKQIMGPQNSWQPSEPRGSKDPNNGVLGPTNTIIFMVFGPQNPIIWVLGPSRELLTTWLICRLGSTINRFQAYTSCLQVGPSVDAGCLREEKESKQLHTSGVRYGGLCKCSPIHRCCFGLRSCALDLGHCM